MKIEKFSIAHIPAVLYGEQSQRIFLFVHGQDGNKEEAKRFARLAVPMGWQVLSVDLPEHGERTDAAKLLPWIVLPELQRVMQWMRKRWNQIAVHATSIGAWFCLLALERESIECYLLVSPLVDMENMIQNMMQWAHVTEAQLQQEREIPTSFGQTLSWEYLCWVREHSVQVSCNNIHILYGEQDELIPQAVIHDFAQKHTCTLTVVKDGEHWLHTPEQLNAMEVWESIKLQSHDGHTENLLDIPDGSQDSR